MNFENKLYKRIEFAQEGLLPRSSSSASHLCLVGLSFFGFGMIILRYFAIANNLIFVFLPSLRLILYSWSKQLKWVIPPQNTRDNFIKFLTKYCKLKIIYSLLGVTYIFFKDFHRHMPKFDRQESHVGY